MIGGGIRRVLEFTESWHHPGDSAKLLMNSQI